MFCSGLKSTSGSKRLKREVQRSRESGHVFRGVDSNFRKNCQ